MAVFDSTGRLAVRARLDLHYQLRLSFEREPVLFRVSASSTAWTLRTRDGSATTLWPRRDG